MSVSFFQKTLSNIYLEELNFFYSYHVLNAKICSAFFPFQTIYSTNHDSAGLCNWLFLCCTIYFREWNWNWQQLLHTIISRVTPQTKEFENFFMLVSRQLLQRLIFFYFDRKGRRQYDNGQQWP